MRTLIYILCWATSASLYGCASTPDAITTVNIEGNASLGTPLEAPFIVADEGGIELAGDELTPEARARFNKERSERVSNRAERVRAWVADPPAKRPGDPIKGLIDCVQLLHAACPAVLAGGVVVMPVVMLTAGALGQAAKGVTYLGGLTLEPSLRLSSKQALRVAAAVKDQATSAALVERAIYTAPADFVDVREAQSRLVVRMKAAQTCAVENAAAICLVAEARAFFGDGVALTPTTHVFVHGPLEPLLSEDRSDLERTIDQAMDLLAESIVAAYTGTGPQANLPLEEAPQPAPAAPLGLGQFTDADRAVFPKTSAGICVREGC